MPAPANGHAAFEAGAHSTERCARLALDGRAEAHDPDSQEGGRERQALLDLVPFSIDDDLDESGHQCAGSVREGMGRIGEYAAGGIGASR